MKKYFFIVGLLFPFALIAQMIEGTVSNNNGEPSIGANVYWLGTSMGVSTEIDGIFEISLKDISVKKLIASYVGYQADTIEYPYKLMLSLTWKSCKLLVK